MHLCPEPDEHALMFCFYLIKPAGASSSLTVSRLMPHAELAAAAAAEAAAAAAKAAAEAAAPREADGKEPSRDVDRKDTEKRAAEEAAPAPAPKRPRSGPGQFAIEAAEEEGARAAAEGDSVAQGPACGEAGAAVADGDEGAQDDQPQWVHMVRPAWSKGGRAWHGWFWQAVLGSLRG